MGSALVTSDGVMDLCVEHVRGELCRTKGQREVHGQKMGAVDMGLHVLTQETKVEHCWISV